MFFASGDCMRRGTHILCSKSAPPANKVRGWTGDVLGRYPQEEGALSAAGYSGYRLGGQQVAFLGRFFLIRRVPIPAKAFAPFPGRTILPRLAVYSPFSRRDVDVGECFAAGYWVLRGRSLVLSRYEFSLNHGRDVASSLHRVDELGPQARHRT